MNRIALLEDHRRMAQFIGRAFEAAGIEVDTFGSVSAAKAAIRLMNYSAMVVDRGLPDGDGLDFIRDLRRGGDAIPCLVLTARDAVHDRIEGLEHGADDYLVKPFSMLELVARVRALLRRPPALQTLTPEFQGLHVMPEHGVMTFGEESVLLAPAEMQIMLTLVKAAGRTVRRTALDSAAWGLGNAVTPNAMDVALFRLRKKLDAIGATLQIATFRGHGYALRGDSDAS
jgi:DNA-binding response OmpR family regulator